MARRRNKGGMTGVIVALAAAGVGILYLQRKKKLQQCFDQTLPGQIQMQHARQPPGRGLGRQAVNLARAETSRGCGGDPAKPFGFV